MKILVTGSAGLVGQSLLNEIFENSDMTAIGLTRSELDLEDLSSVETVLARYLPFDFLINCAAITDVDKCESEPDLAELVNGLAVGKIADFCSAHNVTLVQISTDYVFNGKLQGDYLTTDPVSPCNRYGMSKALGEKLALTNNTNSIVVRTAWVFGPGRSTFVDFLISKITSGQHLKVASDRFGQPTSSVDLSKRILEIVRKSEFSGIVPNPLLGIHHATNCGETSWYGVSRFISHEVDQNSQLIEETSYSTFPTVAARPSRTVLSDIKSADLGLSPMPTWESAVRAHLVNAIENARSDKNA